MAYLMNMAAFDRGAKLIDDMQADERQAKLDARQAEIDAREREKYNREKSDYDSKTAATKAFVGELKKEADGSSVDSFFAERTPKLASPGPMAEGAQVAQSPDNPVANNVVTAQPLATMGSTVQQPFSLPPEAIARRNLLLAEAEFAAKTNPSALPGIKEKLQRFDLGAKASEVHKRVSDMDPAMFGELIKRADLNPQIEVKAIDDGKGGTVLTIGEKKVSLNRQQAADWLTGLYLRDQGDLEGGKAMISSVSKDLAEASTKYQDALFKIRADNRAQVQSGLAVNADGRADSAEGRAQNADARVEQEFDLKLKQLQQDAKIPQAVKAQADVLRESLKAANAALYKAQAEGQYDPNNVGVKQLEKEKAKAIEQFRLLMTPYSNTVDEASRAGLPAMNKDRKPAASIPEPAAPSTKPTSKFASTPAEQDRQMIFQGELKKAQEDVRAAKTPDEADRAQRNLNALLKEMKSNRISIPSMDDAIAPTQPVAAPAAQPTAQVKQAPVASQAAPMTILQAMNPGGDKSIDSVMQPKAIQLQGMAAMFQQAKQKTAEAAQSGNTAAVQKAAVEQQQIRNLIANTLSGMNPQQAASVLKAAGIN